MIVDAILLFIETHVSTTNVDFTNGFKHLKQNGVNLFHDDLQDLRLHCA